MRIEALPWVGGVVILMVTGSRHWTNREFIHTVLSPFAAAHPDVLHGACPEGGADEIADEVARELGMNPIPFPPDERLPKPQRFHVRNDAMLAMKPDLVLAFRARGEKNAGTNSVIRKAKSKGILVATFDVYQDAAKAHPAPSLDGRRGEA